MFRNQRRTPSLCCCFLTLVTAIATLAGCSDDANPTEHNEPDGPAKVSIPLEGALQNIQLTANQTTQVMATFQVPPEIGMIESASLDVAATMQHLQVNNVAKLGNLSGLLNVLAGQEIAQAFIRVGSDTNTVCQQGALYGPYSVSDTYFDSPSPNVDTIELAQSTIQILNSGPAVLCLEIFSSFDATLSIDQLEAEVAESDCGAPADFSGLWTGTYQCGNSCGGGFGGDIQLTITQSGSTASYVDDEGYVYTGRVCGNVFRFERVDADEIERGSIVLEDAAHATKRSTWREQPDGCYGDCIDLLTRAGSQ